MGDVASCRLIITEVKIDVSGGDAMTTTPTVTVIVVTIMLTKTIGNGENYTNDDDF